MRKMECEWAMEYNYQAIRRLMLATTKIDEAYYLFSRKLGVKENTLALLYALDDGEPHSQKQICKDWMIPKTTINTSIKELEEAGYVELFPEKHSREKIISLTSTGKAYAFKIMKSVYESEQRAMEKTLQRFSPEFISAIDLFADQLRDEIEKRLPQQAR